MDLKTPAETARFLTALRHVKAWTRERFELEPGAAVIVEEASTGAPGFPPVQTSVSFWSAPDARHAFTVFKPVGAVSEDDLPPRWMKGALVAQDEEGCSCC